MVKVLLIVDVQNDFCEGGSLAVAESNQIFGYINALKKNRKVFQQVVLTRDWHPQGHVSFASTHGRPPFTNIEINGKQQELWPDHCVVDTKGAEYSPLLEIDNTEINVLKGIEVDVDSYSGFYEGKKGVELRDKLKELNAKQVYVCGLAYDFCVGSTALDSKKYGFQTFVVKQATRPVSKQTAEAMDQSLKQSHIPLISFASI